MLLRFFLFMFFTSTLLASPLLLVDDQLRTSHQGKIEYIIDIENAYTSENIRNISTWKQHEDKAVNFGFDAKTYWYKITIENQSAYTSWVMQFSQATIDYIDLYIFKEDALIKEFHMGDRRYMKDRSVHHPTFLVPIEIKRDDSVEIYFKVISPIHQLGLTFWEYNEFQKHDFDYRFLTSIFFGVLLVIAIYNFVIYFLEKNIAFLYFVGYLIGLASLQFSKIGLYHYFELTPMWVNSYIQYISAVVMVILFTQFLRQFLDTKNTSPRVDLLMRFLIITFALLYFTQFFISLEFSLKATFTSFISIILLLIYFGFSSWKRGLSYRIMSFAWLSFIIASSALALSKLGYIERTFFTEHSFYFGIIIESILMSLALSNQIKEDRENYIKMQKEENIRLDMLVDQRTQEIRKQEQMMIQQAKMAAMGEMIEAIAHQWRQPLNIASMGISKIQLEKDLNVCSIENNTEVLDQINDNIQFMSDTIDDFRNFFKKDKERTTIECHDMIHNVSKLIDSTLKNYGIELELINKSSQPINIFENELKQVILNLVNNAKDAINSSSTKDKRITITNECTTEKCFISIEDTGGGIQEEIIGKVFEPYFTTKSQKSGTGLGLYLAKIIIEENFKGQIRVYNKDAGACFEIELNI